VRVVVAGAGNIGRYLAFDLAERKHDVTVIEKSVEALASVHGEQLRLVAGDACAPEVLEQANVRDADVVVAATGDDEDNLVISLLAKEEFAVPRVLARVNHPTNEWLFDDSWGVDLAVSPPHLLTALVEEEVIAGDVVPLLRLERGGVHLMELRLDEMSEAVGQRVGDLAIPDDIVLVCVLRRGQVVPARATTPLDEGDEVLALVPEGRGQVFRELLVGRV
jgi:trk system potassium uptake protein